MLVGVSFYNTMNVLIWHACIAMAVKRWTNKQKICRTFTCKL